MKKIMYISPSISVKGGISAVIREYLATDISERYKIRLVSSHRDGPKAIKLIQALIGFCKAFYYLTFEGIDVAHVHEGNIVSFKRKFYYLLLLSFFRCKVIFHHHGGALLDEYYSYPEKWQRRIKSTFESCNFVICLTEGWSKDILKIAPKTKTVVLPNSVRIPVIASPSKDILATSVRATSLTFLGHVTESKGIFDLLRVVRELLDAGININLNIGGKGDVHRLRKEISELQLEETVRFWGWVSEKERDELLRNTRIFVLPSYSECLPMSVLEAMSFAVPVVSTSVGGLPEIVVDGETGFLVKPGDLTNLYNRILELLTDDEKRIRFGLNGRKLIEQKYNIRETIKVLDDIYSKL